jgi:peptidyl-dipeptidase Dcp
MKEIMSRPQLLVIAASLLLAPFAQAAVTAANPFFEASPLPFNMPQFAKIHNEDYKPAFVEGMKRHLAEIDKIANNKAAPTFDNTLVAMERSGQLLSRVNSIFGNMAGANTNDTLDAIQTEMAPKLAAHQDAIMLNAKLYQRVKTLYDKRDKLGLNPEQAYLLERYHTDFVLAGADLSAADKEKLKAINGEIATLMTSFSQNVLKGLNETPLIVDTREELAGMTPAATDAAATAAKEKGHPGKFLVPLVNTTGQPPLAVLTNRSVRERLMALSLARGSHGGQYDNQANVLKLAKLRADKGALLGFPNFAAYSLADQTAKNTTAVNTMLAELSKASVAKARVEAADLQKVVDADKGGFTVGAADWALYTEKVRAERFNLDEAKLKPYFELNNVLTKGVFYAATQLYGITFKERHDLPTYDPDVRVFEVSDADGKPLALFLEDFYARPNKQGGAWMNEYVSQSKLLGTKPMIANQLNYPKPPKGEPTLLTFDEVTAMFHEFGHALHGMFSNVTYPRFAGTSVPRDFVEYPSQFNETWAINPQVLHNYAVDYKTGAAMPQDLLDKVVAMKKFNQGFMLSEYLGAATLDQSWHQLAPSAIPASVPAFEAQALKEKGLDFAPVPPRYRTTYFSHAFSGGYEAGYYAYLWAEKLDADTAAWFKENGGLSRKNGDWFRAHILSRGGSDDALELYRQFRGHDAAIDPLLISRGLKDQ